MSVGSFLADPAFPQLEIATDPALMKQTFRTHLRPVGGKVYDIEDCRYSAALSSGFSSLFALHIASCGTGYGARARRAGHRAHIRTEG